MDYHEALGALSAGHDSDRRCTIVHGGNGLPETLSWLRQRKGRRKVERLARVEDL